MASQGKQQALCQLYRHTFVPYSSAESRRMIVFIAQVQRHRNHSQPRSPNFARQLAIAVETLCASSLCSIGYDTTRDAIVTCARKLT